MVYRPVPGLRWLQEAGHIVVINPAAGVSQQLAGHEAAVWDWLNSRHTGAEAARLLALTYDLTEPDAQAALDKTLARWLAVGLVEATDG